MADPNNDSSRDKNLMDEWDEIFESDDPTRVLNPVEFEEKPQRPQREQLSMTTGETQEPGSIKSGKIEPISSTSPLYISDREYTEPLEDTSKTPVVNEAGAQDDYLVEERTFADRYTRLQLLPCLLGWLVSYAVLQLGTTIGKSILSLFNAQHFGVVGNLIPAIQKDVATAAPWLIATGLVIFLGYAAGGYAAARMTRYAPFKQGVGVFFWGLLATIGASIFTYFATPAGSPIVSYQHLSNGNFSTGLIGVIAYFALACVSALIGALFGKRYERLHKKLS